MLRKIFLHPTSHVFIQLIRYGAVVAVAFPIDFGLLYVFTDIFHMYYVLSATLAFTISMIVNYIISVRWVFANRSQRAYWAEISAFAIIGFVGLGLTDVLMWVLSSKLGVYYMASKLIAVCVVFFWSFGARRYLFHGKLSAAEPTTEQTTS